MSIISKLNTGLTYLCAGVVCKELIQYYGYIISIFEVLMYTFLLILDLVKRSVLILVGEIWRYRNDHYYYLQKSKKMCRL